MTTQAPKENYRVEYCLSSFPYSVLGSKMISQRMDLAEVERRLPEPALWLIWLFAGGERRDWKLSRLYRRMIQEKGGLATAPHIALAFCPPWKHESVVRCHTCQDILCYSQFDLSPDSCCPCKAVRVETNGKGRISAIRFELFVQPRHQIVTVMESEDLPEALLQNGEYMVEAWKQIGANVVQKALGEPLEPILPNDSFKSYFRIPER